MNRRVVLFGNWQGRILELAAALAALGLALPIRAQPTYKLDVKTNLKPRAAIWLENDHIRRSPVKDDPGFRLQYRFTKDGKRVATVEARSQASLAIQERQAGTYTVVLELFYPAYKGGSQQKGEFRPISNLLTYMVLVKQGSETWFLDVGTPSAFLFYGLQAGRQFPCPAMAR